MDLHADSVAETVTEESSQTPGLKMFPCTSVDVRSLLPWSQGLDGEFLCLQYMPVGFSKFIVRFAGI